MEPPIRACKTVDYPIDVVDLEQRWDGSLCHQPSDGECERKKRKIRQLPVTQKAHIPIVILHEGVNAWRDLRAPRARVPSGAIFDVCDALREGKPECDTQSRDERRQESGEIPFATRAENVGCARNDSEDIPQEDQTAEDAVGTNHRGQCKADPCHDGPECVEPIRGGDRVKAVLDGFDVA